MCNKVKMRWQTSGVMTVFFTLLSTAFLAVFLVLAESARVQGARVQAANIVDLGNYSVFAEYEKGLLEGYEIFAVNGAYGTGDFSIGRVKDRLRRNYLANAHPDAEGLSALCFEPWKLSLRDLSVSGYTLLSDQGAEPFYQQAVSYMKETSVTGIITALIRYYRQATDMKDAADQYEAAESDSDPAMEKDTLPNGQDPGEGAQEEEGEGASPIENPLSALNRLRKKTLLQIVLPDGNISEKKIASTALWSKRWGNEHGTMAPMKEHGTFTDDLLFREYLLHVFPSYQTDASKTAAELDYQVEYILCGKRSDEANLKGTVQRLLWLREGCNYLYSTKDGALSGTAEAFASGVLGWTGSSALVGALKHALLLGISYAESLSDVRILLGGGKVPLKKDAQSWRISFSSLAEINEVLAAVPRGNETGLSYKEHLRLLLYLQGIDVQKRRGLDLLECNVRAIRGQSNFRADHCVVAIRTMSTWQVSPVFDSLSRLWIGQSTGTEMFTVQSGFSYDAY